MLVCLSTDIYIPLCIYYICTYIDCCKGLHAYIRYVRYIHTYEYSFFGSIDVIGCFASNRRATADDDTIFLFRPLVITFSTFISNRALYHLGPNHPREGLSNTPACISCNVIHHHSIHYYPYTLCWQCARTKNALLKLCGLIPHFRGVQPAPLIPSKMGTFLCHILPSRRDFTLWPLLKKEESVCACCG